jgi:hypothetical protein
MKGPADPLLVLSFYGTHTLPILHGFVRPIGALSGASRFANSGAIGRIAEHHCAHHLATHTAQNGQSVGSGGCLNMECLRFWILTMPGCPGWRRVDIYVHQLFDQGKCGLAR